MKTLLIVDKMNWAYCNIAKSLIKHNQDSSLSFKILPVKGGVTDIKKAYKKFDQFFVLGYQNCEPKLGFLPKNNTLVGIHSHQSFDNKRTTPEKDVDPPQHIIGYLRQFKRVNTVSNRLHKLFAKNGLLTTLTENGVETDVFQPLPIKLFDDPFVVGYSGTHKHDDNKGVTGLIVPAAKKSGAKPSIATDMKPDQMPRFYNMLDVYVCASNSEGFSLAVLEAASCGKPIISTRVGGCVDLIKDGENGFLVDRNVDSIAQAIEKLKDREVLKSMSDNIRKTIVDHYCWSKKVGPWIDFIKG